MRIYHGGFYVFVSEQFLDGADVVAVLEEVRGEGVAEGVGGDLFVYVGKFGSLSNCFLGNGFIEMMTADEPCEGVGGTLGCGEDELPCPFFGCGAVFDFKSVGKDGVSVAFHEVFLVKGFYVLEHVFEFGYQTFGEDGEAVVVAFAAANDDTMVVEVEIFDTQAQAFHNAKPATVHDFCHDTSGSTHLADHFHRFGVCENGGESFGSGGIG